MRSTTIFSFVGCMLVTAVYANPTPNQIENCGSHADIVFILDSSGSIDSSEYVVMQQFVEDVVAELGEGDNARFGYTAYANSAWVEFYLNNHTTTADALSTISGLTRRSSGGTNTHTGLALARSMFTAELGDRPGHTNIGIIFTDGQSSDGSATIAEAEANKQTGIRMISIGVGSGYNLAELNAIASEPILENVFTVTNFDGLTAILAEVCEAVEDIEIADPESVTGGSYDCAENNPCSPSLRTPDMFYYRHVDDARFVQCSPCGNCLEISCGVGSVWDDTFKTCACAEVVEEVIGYSCDGRNPCNPLEVPHLYYYPHTSANMFVQCSQWGQCYEMPCGPTLIWSQDILGCIVPP